MAAPLLLTSVPAQTPYVQYIASSNQTVFPYPFEITQDQDLVCVVNGATLGTDVGYTLSGQGAVNGGNLTFTLGRTAGDIVTIYRNITISRSSQLPQNGTFFSSTFNAEYNRIYLIMQQLQEATNFYLQIPNTNVPSGSGTILAPANYAGMYLSFDENGNPEPAILTSSGAITQSIIGQKLYPQTADELALGVTPTNYYYPADPYVDPRRYGAVTGLESTAAVQTAINVAYHGNGLVWIGENCNFLIGASAGLTLTATGNHNTNGLRIVGSSVSGSRLTLNGTPSALLTIVGSTPTGSPQEFPFVMENLTLYGNSTTVNGIELNGVAYAVFKNVYVLNFQYALYLYSVVNITVQGGALYGSTVGLYARTDSTGTPCNLVRLRDVLLSGNTTSAIDFDYGSLLWVEGCDIEACGLTGHTAAIHIGANIGASSDVAVISITRNWFEANYQDIQVDTPAHTTNVSIRDCQMLSETSTSIVDGGSSFLEITNCSALSAAATWTLAASYLTLRNSTVTTLTDTSTYPVYENVVSENGGRMTWGRKTSATMTLTGCTTSPTCTAYFYQQGQDVLMDFISSLQATSNTDACTITGLPAGLKPPQTVGFVGPVSGGTSQLESGQQCQLGTNGTITLYWEGSATGFATSGTKGLDICQARWRIS